VGFQVSLAQLETTVAELLLEMQHDSELFPAGSGEKITFTAGGVADTFGAWAEVAVDGNGTTF